MALRVHEYDQQGPAVRDERGGGGRAPCREGRPADDDHTMAAASGYPKRSLLRWLNTERSIGVEPLFAMAGALGVPAAELVRRAEKRVASARDGRDGTVSSDAERRQSTVDETSPGVSVGGATVRPLHGDDAYVEYVPSDLQAANDDGVDPELEAEGAAELP